MSEGAREQTYELLIVSDAGHRGKLRKLIFNLHRFLLYSWL